MHPLFDVEFLWSENDADGAADAVHGFEFLGELSTDVKELVRVLFFAGDGFEGFREGAGAFARRAAAFFMSRARDA